MKKHYFIVDSKIVLFTALTSAVIFALITPFETAVAQNTESNVDDKYKEGNKMM